MPDLNPNLNTMNHTPLIQLTNIRKEYKTSKCRIGLKQH